MSPFNITSRSQNHVPLFMMLISSVILYIYIYNPIFVAIKIGLIKVLTLCGLVYCFNHKYVVSNYLGYYKKEIGIVLFCIIYCTFIVLINNGDSTSTPYVLFVWLLETTIVPIFLINAIFVKYKISLLGILIPISLFASGISVLLFLSPGLNDFVLGGLIEKPYENHLGIWDRCFGLSEGLTSSYGVIQGIFASICLLKGRTVWRYYFYALIIAFSAIINARTGIIPVIITLLYICFRSIKGGNLRFFVFIAIAVYITSIFISKYSDVYSDTLAYVSLFFTSSYDYFVNGDTGADYYGAVSGFIHFPDTTLGILFGKGEDHFHGKVSRSDIAYINQIYTGGLVYLFSLIYLQVMIYKKFFKRYKDFFLVVLLFFTALIINFKGIPFCISESFTRFVMLFYFVVLHNIIYPEKKINIGL